MDFLDCFSMVQSSNPIEVSDRSKQLSIKYISQQVCCNFSTESSGLGCVFALGKHCGMPILARICFLQRDNTSVTVDLNNFINQKTISHQHRLNLIKYLLRINNSVKLFNFRLEPQSGVLDTKLYLNYNSSCQRPQNIVESLEMFWEQLLILVDEVLYAANHLIMTNQQNNNLQQKTIKYCQRLKTYVNSSSQYSWAQMAGEDSNKANCLYKQKKSDFRNSLRTIGVIRQFKYSRVLNFRQSELKKFVALRVDEDEQLKIKYLNFKQLINLEGQLVNQIQLDQADIANIQQMKILKIKLKDKSIKLQIRNTNDPTRNQYERSILQSFPENFDYSGLSRYYYVQNQKESTKNVVLTSYVDQMPIHKFILKNNHTITYQTKLLLLNQVTKILKYLRDSGIVYNNLQPKNIMVRKQLALKLVDLASCFSHNPYRRLHARNEQNQSQYYPFQNKFPYVTIDKTKKSFANQKSDVNSFGILAYQVLFSKSITNIKEINLTPEKHILTLKNFLICATQKFNFRPEGKLIGSFLLSTLADQSLSTSKTGKCSRISTNNRPYLDWIVIIMGILSQSPLFT